MELKSKEICEIIKAAEKANVNFLEYGSLKLDFGPKRNETQTSQPSNASQVNQATPEKIESIREQSNVELQIRQAEDNIEELMLTDPERYEDMLANGELEDVKLQPEPSEKAV